MSVIENPGEYSEQCAPGSHDWGLPDDAGVQSCRRCGALRDTDHEDPAFPRQAALSDEVVPLSGNPGVHRRDPGATS